MTVNIESGFDATKSAQSSFDDDYAMEAVSPQTVLDTFREALQQEVVIPQLEVPVPGRKGLVVSFDLDIDANLIGLWQKRAKDPSLPDKIDVRKIGAIIIADRARVIRMNGHNVIDTQTGKSLTFTDKQVQDMLGVKTSLAAVKKMYVLDASIIRTSKRIMEEAGYGDDVDWDDTFEDPTQTSSIS